MAAEGDKLQVVKRAINSVKMHNPGRSLGQSLPLATKKSSDVIYPSLHLDVKEAPFLKGYQVGDECCLLMRVKITGHHSDQHRDGPQNDRYNLDIINIGRISHKPVGGKEEYGM